MELIVGTNFADAVDVSQSSIAGVLAFLGHPCGGVVSEIEDFDNAPKSQFNIKFHKTKGAEFSAP